MSTDPVQLLIDAGAIPASPFSESSRYRGVALATLARADGVPQAYVMRRLIAARREIAIAVQHIVRAGERSDLLAYQHYGNALLYWRIADGNAVIDPLELTDSPGARVAVPVPPSGT